MRHICPISGKDSLATALVLREHEPDLSVEYVWHDTGWELPEVHEWICDVEQVLGPIHRCGDDLTEIVAEQGLLPSHHRRFCTKYAKIHPMRDYLGKSERVLYLGLRADEDDRITGLKPSKNETLSFPLKDHGLTLEDVWELVSRHNLKPPGFFWDWMYNRVVNELGGKRPGVMKEWEWLSLFSGRSRPNCDICFYQRLYEWVWLYETHPDCFWRGVRIEESTQDKSPFKLIRPDFPLTKIVERAGDIKEKRARQIMKILDSRSRVKLWDEPDLQSTVNCGMYCGK